MSYPNKKIAELAENLKKQIDSSENKLSILRSKELRAMYAQVPLMPKGERAEFGKQLNQLKNELHTLIDKAQQISVSDEDAIDITAPFDVNVQKHKRPKVLGGLCGSTHPLTQELGNILQIFYGMGFEAVESRQIDNDFNMFEALNFPKNHPARDDMDTFMTEETDKEGKSFVAPAHTSTMQNRVLKSRKHLLKDDKPISVVIPGRVFRNEDLDATHEHTFYQLEGIYVYKDVNVGNLIATLKIFLEEYLAEDLQVRTQPFYFPFTEPSFEFAIKRPGRDWMELLGCGMIHPNVLKYAGIDPVEYSGFAWGFGVDRLVMMKYGIEDVRYFESGRLEFLRQFK